MLTGKMAVITKDHKFQTEGEEIDLVDLTSALESFVEESDVPEGKVTIFVSGSTGAIFVTEFEPFLIEDTKKILSQLIERDADYKHDEIDPNTHAHLRSTLLGPEMTVPIRDGKLVFGL